MASAALYLRTNSCNPAYTGVPYRGIGKYSDCLLLLSLRCCTSPHLHRHRSLMCGTGKLSAQSHIFWLFALPDCSKSHICHPTDNSSLTFKRKTYTISHGMNDIKIYNLRVKLALDYLLRHTTPKTMIFQKT